MWLYNNKIYRDKKEMREILQWSRKKWEAKYLDGKITKINEETSLNKKIHCNSDRSN